MTKKTKIYIAVFLLIVSFNAKAVLPVIWAGISAVSTAASTLSTFEVGLLFAGSAAALYGQQMGYLDLKKDNDSGSVRIPLTDLPRDRPAVDLPPNTPLTKPILNPDTLPISKVCPADYSDSPATLAGCKYITNYTHTKLSDFSCSISFSKTPVSGCDSSNAYVLNSGSAGSVSTTNGCPSGYTSSSGVCSKNPETPSCESGYTLANGQCSLAEPETIPDKNCDLTSSSGTFTKPSADPDCASSPVNVSPSGSAYIPVMLPDPVTGIAKEHHIIISPSGSGTNCFNSVCVPVTPTAGHSQIGVVSPNSTANSSNFQAISVNSDGVVDGVKSGTISGTIATTGTYVDANGNTQTITPANPVLVQTASNGQLVQAVPAAPSQVINFPSDYARSGEASNAADKITNKLSESEPMIDLGTPEVSNPLIQYFNPLYAWAPNVVVGSCPAGVFTWNNNTYGFSQFCTLFEEYAPAIQSVMMVISVIFSLFIVLGA